MSVTLTTLISDAKKSKYSLTNHLSESDVLSIWDGLCDFIEKNMLQIKGVNLFGFGTFTFSRRKVEVGGGKALMILRPVFAMSESLIQSHSLVYLRQMASGQIPVVSVNYTVLSNGTPYSRDTVELAIQEILQSLERAITLSKNIEIDFPKIGKLVIKEKKSRMLFFREFLRSIDGTGKIEYAFRQSLNESEGSVISKQLPKLLGLPSETCSDVVTCSVQLSHPSPGAESLLKSSVNKTQVENRSCTPHNFCVGPMFLSSQENGSNLIQNEGIESCPQYLENKRNICYVCHQRELRNVPVYLYEEKKKKEKLHEKLLQKFQQKKTALLLAREKATKLHSFEKAKEAAQFNLHVTENRKLNEKQDSVRNSDYQPSCIFSHRPSTPCFTRKQAEYCHQLDEQIRRRRNAIEAIMKHETSIEKDEQNRLTKELSLIKEAHNEKVKNLKASYLQSLHDQVHFKHRVNRSPSPTIQPVFVVQEDIPKPSHYRKNAEELFKNQYAFVLQQKQTEKVKALEEKEEEAKQLKLNMLDYKRDVHKSRLDRCIARKELENYWQDTLKKKELDAQKPASGDLQASYLLHDQCKKYQRCCQCQKKLDNIGRSNILAESRYTAGARLIL